jgi:hypothetical protein
LLFSGRIQERSMLRIYGRRSPACDGVSRREVLQVGGLSRVGSLTFPRLLEAAGVTIASAGPSESKLRRAVGRLLHVDDQERIDSYRRLLDQPTAPSIADLPLRDHRLHHMLAASIGDQALTAGESTQDAVDLLWDHPQVRAELLALLYVLDQRVDHLHQPLATYPDVPLQIHARYTRIEILAAFGLGGEGKIPSWQSGVWEAKPANAELFAFTLDKSTGGFSPTTRYRDYAISPTLIHWESQSSTREDSATGLRYRNHERDGRSILLFTRLRNTERAFWFLGPARYRGHTGEKPMAITWELAHPLSGDMFASFAAAAGRALGPGAATFAGRLAEGEIALLWPTGAHVLRPDIAPAETALLTPSP